MAVALATVAREWGRIGTIGFGGPPAHVALLRELCVERRGWIDATEFEDANAACGLLPGPASTQLSIYCAHRVAGVPGALVGGLAFILPGLLIILVLAGTALAGGAPEWLLAAGAGAGATVVPVIADAGVALARSSLARHAGWRMVRAVAYMAVGVAAAIFAGLGVLLALLACGLVELAIRRAPPRIGSSNPAVHAWPVLFAAAAQLAPLAWTALKVGALSFGGGFVIIPLMQADAVDARGWMTHAEFLNAVAFGQITPGPVTHTVAVVGWAADGLPGALLASAIAFAPSFVLVLLLAPRFAALRASVPARAFLDGAGPAAVGAILGAAVVLLDGVDHAWQWVLLGLAAGALLLGRRPIEVLLTGFVAGIVLWALGAPV
ncbi:chromate efflux transporter [Capillimicrobium parvum]|uniref:Chromate transport protein n=1 Tax=Capillimicrobium parvum TaxID=2884022 RepID=A0A9E6Y3J8_9ACTN|nr:chromate efflux transporter [Capillimicrobium parvum]UGS39230.1 putative chromate transport protein [Capillimicrobium parvum]